MIEINLQAETNIKGLFAAGDEVGNFRADISGAAVFGCIAGGSAARRAKQTSTFQKVEASDRIEKRIQLFTDIWNGATSKIRAGKKIIRPIVILPIAFNLRIKVNLNSGGQNHATDH